MDDLGGPQNLTSRRLLTYVLTTVVAIVGLTGCQTGQPHCQEGQELAKNGQLAAAAEAFAMGQLKAEGRCADDGLEAVTDEHADATTYVAQGKAAEAMGDLPDAQGSYHAALRVDVGNAAALAGLSRVTMRPTEPTTLWLVAQRLNDEGYHDDARDEIVRVLREHPEEVVPQSLAQLAPFGAGGTKITSNEVTAVSGFDLSGWVEVLLILLVGVLAGIGLNFGSRIHRHTETVGRKLDGLNGRADFLVARLGSLEGRAKTLIDSLTQPKRPPWRRRGRAFKSHDSQG